MGAKKVGRKSTNCMQYSCRSAGCERQTLLFEGQKYILFGMVLNFRKYSSDPLEKGPLSLAMV